VDTAWNQVPGVGTVGCGFQFQPGRISRTEVKRIGDDAGFLRRAGHLNLDMVVPAIAAPDGIYRSGGFPRAATIQIKQPE